MSNHLYKVLKKATGRIKLLVRMRKSMSALAAKRYVVHIYYLHFCNVINTQSSRIDGAGV